MNVRFDLEVGLVPKGFLGAIGPVPNVAPVQTFHLLQLDPSQFCFCNTDPCFLRLFKTYAGLGFTV